MWVSASHGEASSGPRDKHWAGQRSPGPWTGRATPFPVPCVCACHPQGDISTFGEDSKGMTLHIRPTAHPDHLDRGARQVCSLKAPPPAVGTSGKDTVTSATLASDDPAPPPTVVLPVSPADGHLPRPQGTPTRQRALTSYLPSSHQSGLTHSYVTDGSSPRVLIDFCALTIPDWPVGAPSRTLVASEQPHCWIRGPPAPGGPVGVFSSLIHNSSKWTTQISTDTER